MTRKYDLLLANGKVATWSGEDGEDAARRYVDCKGGEVVAWRGSREPRIRQLGRRSVIDGRPIL